MTLKARVERFKRKVGLIEFVGGVRGKQICEFEAHRLSD